MGSRSFYRGALRLAVWLLVMTGFLVFFVTLTPIDDWWASRLEGSSFESSGEALIVLGGSMFGDGTMGWSSYLRSMYAVRTYSAGGFHHVIVTGGSKIGPPVAKAMRDFIVCQGVPSEVTEVETASLSTRQNAFYVKELLHNLPGPKVLLTSDYHMFRARRVFAKLGVQVLPLPVPDARKRAASWLGRWPAFIDLVQETGKIGYYRLRGWI